MLVGRNQAEIQCHELAGIAEAGHVAKFGHQCASPPLPAPLPRSACSARTSRCQRPVRQHRFNICFQTVAHVSRGRLDGTDAVLQDDRMHGLDQRSGRRASVGASASRPGDCSDGRAGAAGSSTVAGELDAACAPPPGAHAPGRGSPHAAWSGNSRPRVNSPARCSLGEIDRIPPVGLDPVTGACAGLNDGATTTHPCTDALSCSWMPYPQCPAS